jgi:hypothetical protein
MAAHNSGVLAVVQPDTVRAAHFQVYFATVTTTDTH